MKRAPRDQRDTHVEDMEPIIEAATREALINDAYELLMLKDMKRDQWAALIAATKAVDDGRRRQGVLRMDTDPTVRHVREGWPK